MEYRIIVDSCGELSEEMKKDEHFASVALELEIDNERIVDDETFNQAEFLRKVKESPNGPKSSCPSPEAYMNAFPEEAKRIYIVTLSGKLSGSYNSAVLAKNLYEEEHDDKEIYVFDSRSASIGETLIARKVKELEEQGLPFAEIVKEGEAYTDELNTYFVLESLETLRKAGRLSNLKAKVASVLNIKPVMGSTDEGSICQLGQGRGMNKALDVMVDTMMSKTKDCKGRVLAISHCNCPERAEKLKKKLEAKNLFKEIMVLDTAGVSSMYANDGGVIMVV